MRSAKRLIPPSFLVVALVLTVFAVGTSGGAGKSSHSEYFEHYEGTATCLACHRDEAESFFHSQHYQWEGEAPAIVNAEGQRLGKMNTINDFCTNPRINWIGSVRNERGDVLAQGCSKCHAGNGLLPEKVMSDRQLENIDCLICHASGYRRGLYENDDGTEEWRPILWRNQEGLDSVSKRISSPTRTMCLRCHSASGGGPNYKRGDIEYALADCEPEFDVHMASSGTNMQCATCHAGEDHRVRGRGADLSGSDSPDAPLDCTECHEAQPHAARILDHHTDRVHCTSCHIPTFAKEDATDMFRDWSKSTYNEEKAQYKPVIELAKDVEPVYAWFNGTTRATLPRTPVEPLPTGEVATMLPMGSKDDPDARLHAFKLHRARLPVLDEQGWLIPIITEEFYVDGNMDKWVKEAARELYGVEDAKYHWVDTVRYMGLYHEVVPAKSALGCLDCHGPRTRLDWAGLGYEGDPLDALIDAVEKKTAGTAIRKEGRSGAASTSGNGAVSGALASPGREQPQ